MTDTDPSPNLVHFRVTDAFVDYEAALDTLDSRISDLEDTETAIGNAQAALDVLIASRDDIRANVIDASNIVVTALNKLQRAADIAAVTTAADAAELAPASFDIEDELV